MNKKSIIIIIISAIVIVTTGVALLILNSSETIFAIKITEFEKYKRIISPPQSINVTFDDQYIGTFTIDNEEQIREIHSILLTRTYIKVEAINPTAPNNGMVFVYSNEETISINTKYIIVDSQIYSPKDDDMLDYILLNIGLEQGKLTTR